MTISDSSKYQFDPDKAYQTMPESQAMIGEEQRVPFNEAIGHGDIVQGFQTPKTSEQLPKWYRTPRKIFTVLMVVLFIATLVYTTIQTVLNA